MSQTVPNPLLLLSDVLSYWINEHTDVPVTWESLIVVLKSASISENVLAEKIHSKYCQVSMAIAENKSGKEAINEGEAYLRGM